MGDGAGAGATQGVLRHVHRLNDGTRRRVADGGACQHRPRSFAAPPVGALLVCATCSQSSADDGQRRRQRAGHAAAQRTGAHDSSALWTGARAHRQCSGAGVDGGATGAQGCAEN